MSSPWHAEFEREGLMLLPRVFSTTDVEAMTAALSELFHREGTQDASIRGDEGAVYAARNVLRLWPEAGLAWRRPVLLECLSKILGPDFGLVRILFFDKPPRQTWALPWHKDLTIAVRNNRLPSGRFGKPTRKAGVPHVEAPRDVLERMVTGRIHLDDVTDENGPLKVIPRSHHAGKALKLDVAPPRVVHCGRGDVLLIRPLVAHCSGKSHPETTLHRRVLHLEFAASPSLPDGYAWHDFVPGAA
jgi:hypothetical protein